MGLRVLVLVRASISDEPQLLGIGQGHAAGGRSRCVLVIVLSATSTGIGVLFDCFARKIDGNFWFTWWFNHLPGPSISPKRIPMSTRVTSSLDRNIIFSNATDTAGMKLAMRP